MYSIPPDREGKQLLEGDWDIKEGAAFTEFDRNIHVIEPFSIPRNWVKFRACDYGYGSYSGVLWFAVSKCVRRSMRARWRRLQVEAEPKRDWIHLNRTLTEFLDIRKPPL
mgnify:CR=1 FL=1